MKKKGFTLIELLAVIVVLAIIALIAVPIMLGVIDKAKKGSAEASVYGYLKSVDNKIFMSKMDQNIPDVVDGIYDVNDLDVSMKGTKPVEGWYVIQNNQVTSYKLKFDKWWFSLGDEPDINFELVGNNVLINDEKYYIDDQVTIKIATANYLFTQGVSNTVSGDLVDDIKIQINGVLLSQEEIENIKGDKLNLYLLPISESGTYTIDVETTYKNNTNTKSMTVNIDNKEPKITAIETTKILQNADYDFSDNISVEFGISGGTVSCDPASSRKTGSYSVTCKAIANNDKIQEVTFQVKHSYSAQAHTTNSSVRCGHWDPLDGSAGGGTCSSKRFRCSKCGAETTAYTCAAENGSGWGNGDHYKTVTNTTYSCPNGGTLSGTTCYY